MSSSLSPLIKKIESATRIGLVAHVRPDGDAIGSLVALGRALQMQGKEVFVFVEEHISESLQFIDAQGLCVCPPQEPVKLDIAIALDCANKPRLGQQCLRGLSKVAFWINIDHHITNTGYGDLHYIDGQAAATGEIIYDLIREASYPIDSVIRDALYVAISTDTGSFQFANTTQKTLQIAAELVAQGVDVASINQKIYANYPLRRIYLLKSLLDSLVLIAQNRIAYWTLTKETKEELHMQPDDCEGLINTIRSIQGVEIAIFFDELLDGTIRVSLRSHTPQYNVSHIAAEYGGGGHACAAGIRLEGVSLQDALQKVLATAQSAL